MKFNAEIEQAKRRVDEAIAAARSGKDVVIMMNGIPVGTLKALRPDGTPQPAEGHIEIDDASGLLLDNLLEHMKARRDGCREVGSHGG